MRLPRVVGLKNGGTPHERALLVARRTTGGNRWIVWCATLHEPPLKVRIPKKIYLEREKRKRKVYKKKVGGYEES